MRIHEIFIVSSNEFPEGWELVVDDKDEMSMCNLNEVPEDALLCRGLNDIYKVRGLMQRAYEAGRRGEALDVTSETLNEEDMV